MLLSEFLKGLKNSKYLLSKDAGSFKEAEHPRGQPENAGQFTSGSASGKTSEPSKKEVKQKSNVLEKPHDAPEVRTSVESIFKDVGGKVKIDIIKSSVKPKDEILINATGSGLKWESTINRKAKDLFLDSIHVSRTKQGKDIGKNLIKNAIAFAKSEGLNSISLWAAERVGIYAWAKLGFNYDTPDALEDAKEGLNRFCKDNGVKIPKEKLSSIKTVRDVAEFKVEGKKVKDMELGKYFMLELHGSWSGRLEI